MRHSHSSLRGLSILELLVSLSVSLVLLGLIMGMLSTTLDTWKNTGRYRQQHQSARIVFDIIEADLRATILRPELPSDQMEKIPWLKIEADSTRAGNSSRLSLLASIPDQSRSWDGDVCLVQYELGERKTRDGQNLMLFRELRAPRTVWSSREWGADFLPGDEAFTPSSIIASHFASFRVDLEVTAADGSSRIISGDVSPQVTRDGDVSWDSSSEIYRLKAVQITAEIVGFDGLNVLFGQGYAAIPANEIRSFFHRVPLGDGL